MHTIRQSICSVIPPHIFRHGAAHGDAETRERFSATLERTAALRRVRHRAAGRAAVAETIPQRYRVYDGRHRYRLPGHLLVDETKGLIDDVEAREALDGAVATREFYAAVFGRTSIDGGSLAIDSTVHYGSHFDNALWNGSRMIYGDGDGKVFRRFTIAVDVTMPAHGSPAVRWDGFATSPAAAVGSGRYLRKSLIRAIASFSKRLDLARCGT